MEKIKFVYGQRANLSNQGVAEGTVRVTPDTQELFFDLEGKRVQIKDVIFVDSLPDELIAEKVYVTSTGVMWSLIGGEAVVIGGGSGDGAEVYIADDEPATAQLGDIWLVTESDKIKYISQKTENGFSTLFPIGVYSDNITMSDSDNTLEEELKLGGSCIVAIAEDGSQIVEEYRTDDVNVNYYKIVTDFIETDDSTQIQQVMYFVDADGIENKVKEKTITFGDNIIKEVIN